MYAKYLYLNIALVKKCEKNSEWLDNYASFMALKNISAENHGMNGVIQKNVP
jgi:4-alpha-glucanotransferase